MQRERPEELRKASDTLVFLIFQKLLFRRFPLRRSLFSTALILSMWSTAQAQDASQPPLALVNGISIHAEDVQCVVEASPLPLVLPVPSETSGEATQRNKADALDRLIALELLYQESLKHRYSSLPIEVEERYRREVERVGGEAHLQAALRCNDMTPETFRKTLFRNLSINRYLEDHVFDRIDIREEEVQDYYARHRSTFSNPPSLRLRQILIRVPSWDDPQRVRVFRNRADQVCEMALAGGDFETLARRFSEDPAGAATGGDLGVVTQGNRRFPFFKEVLTLDAGGVSRPLASRQGFHILKVVERLPATEQPLEEVRAKIVSGLRQEKAALMISELVRSLRSKADIRIVHAHKVSQ